VNREVNHKVNNYTKNVSQHIFSPGVISESVKSRPIRTAGAFNKRRLGKQRRSINIPKNMKQYSPQRANAIQLNKAAGIKKIQKPKSSNKSYRSIKSLSRQIQRERK
jgi:hypothetical protein